MWAGLGRTACSKLLIQHDQENLIGLKIFVIGQLKSTSKGMTGTNLDAASAARLPGDAAR